MNDVYHGHCQLVHDRNRKRIDREWRGFVIHLLGTFLDFIYVDCWNWIHNSTLTGSLTTALMSSRSATGYHLECTGNAAETAQAHAPHLNDAAASTSIQFMGACFCPFVQRAWIALEFLNQTVWLEKERKVWGVDYTYIEIDPYKKPKELVEISPKGLVPVSNRAPPRFFSHTYTLTVSFSVIAGCQTRPWEIAA